MKQSKIVKWFVSLLAIAALCFATMPMASAADSSVQYQGGAEKFVFLPGSDQSPTDLFDNFKGVMPGDTRTQAVQVRNNLPEGTTVRLYLRADAVDEQYQEFLSQMTLQVMQGDKTIFEAAADQQDSLSENVLLGEFVSNGTTELKITLNVPLTMGNDFQNAVGKIRWVFTAEEIPDEEIVDSEPPLVGPSSNPEEVDIPDDDVPGTGGRAMVPVIAGLLAISAGCCVLIVINKRRNNDQH